MSRKMSGGLGAAVVTMFVLSGAVVLGQGGTPPASPAAGQEPGPYQATLRSGTCDELGDVAAVLADPMLGAPSGEEASVDLGPAPEQALRVSESEVPMPLTDIAEGGHALVVDDPVGGDVIACGDVGGHAIGEDRLPVVLAGADGATIGVALLSALGIDATQLLVVLAIPGERSEAPQESPGPSQSPDAEGFVEPDPDEPGPDPDPDVDPGEDIDEDVSA